MSSRSGGRWRVGVPSRSEGLAIVGATGQVGVVLRSILVERSFAVDEMRYLASSRSAGTTLPWGDQEIVVEDAFTADLSGIDLALCSAPASVSRLLAPRLADAGAIVIDNSSSLTELDRQVGDLWTELRRRAGSA